MRAPRKLIAALALGAVIVLAIVGTASAGPILQNAVTALKSNSVYIDPAANPTLTPDQASNLRDMISGSDGVSIFVAVLPRTVKAELTGLKSGEDAGQYLVRTIGGSVGLNGIYVVWAGPAFRVLVNSSVKMPEAAAKATQLYQKYAGSDGTGIYPTVSRFIEYVQSQSINRATSTTASSSSASNSQVSPSKNSGGMPGYLIALITVLGVLMCLVLLMIFFTKRIARKRKETGNYVSGSGSYDPPVTHRPTGDMTEQPTRRPRGNNSYTGGTFDMSRVGPTYYPPSYGFYPGYGWGYYGDGGFIQGMLFNEMLHDHDGNGNGGSHHAAPQPDPVPVAAMPDRSDPVFDTGPSGGDVGGGGSLDDDPAPSHHSGGFGGSDDSDSSFGGGGGLDLGGFGGGGIDFGGGGSSSGGGDVGGGGDL